MNSLEDRRYRLPAGEPATIACRVCFEDVILHPDEVQQTIADTFFRCPQCHRTFLVRRCDWWPG